MGFHIFKKPQVLADLQQRGNEAADEVREAAMHAAGHVSALAQLFRLEVQEYGVRQAKRLAAAMAGLLLLLVGYLSFCAFLCVIMQAWLGSWLWATGLVCLVNVLAGVVLATVAVCKKPGALAPATRQELKDDVQCLKILLRPEKKKS